MTVFRRVAVAFRMRTTAPNAYMDLLAQVNRTLDDVLSLGGRARSFTRDTPLLGAIAELDSMVVVGLISTLEERFGIVVDDDDVDGSTFASVGSLVDFVAGKLAG